MKTFDEIEFDSGTTVHIQGITFWLSRNTVVYGNAENLSCLKLGRHLPEGQITSSEECEEYLNGHTT